MMDGQEMARLLIEFPSATGTDETMDFKRPFPVIASSGMGPLQFPDDIFNGLIRIRLFRLSISMDSIRCLSHRMTS
jgi:hypothetical protein